MFNRRFIDPLTLLDLEIRAAKKQDVPYTGKGAAGFTSSIVPNSHLRGEIGEWAFEKIYGYERRDVFGRSDGGWDFIVDQRKVDTKCTQGRKRLIVNQGVAHHGAADWFCAFHWDPEHCIVTSLGWASLELVRRAAIRPGFKGWDYHEILAENLLPDPWWCQPL